MSFDIRHAVYCAICGAPFNYDTDHGILYHHHEDHETGTLYRPRGRFTEDHLTVRQPWPARVKAFLLRNRSPHIPGS